MMVDFKFDARRLSMKTYLDRSWVSKKVNRKFVLVGGTARANPT